MITFDEFKNIELKVGTIMSAERVEGSEKLVKLSVDCGEEKEGVKMFRQILAGIGKAYEPHELVSKQIVVVANLAPRMMMGLESNGMLLAADNEGNPVILSPSQEVRPGSTVR